VRAVVDTNILVSALLFPGSKPSRAFRFVREHGTALASADTLLELYEVLMRRKFDRYVGRKRRLVFLGALSRTAALVRLQETITACSDPKDNMFLEVAVAGKADVIITGDQALLDLHPFRGIAILTPAAFLERYASRP
jgi:putative PIN family toxin of toxin-antitoxin system